MLSQRSSSLRIYVANRTACWLSVRLPCLQTSTIRVTSIVSSSSRKAILFCKKTLGKNPDLFFLIIGEEDFTRRRKVKRDEVGARDTLYFPTILSIAPSYSTVSRAFWSAWKACLVCLLVAKTARIIWLGVEEVESCEKVGGGKGVGRRGRRVSILRGKLRVNASRSEGFL